MTSPPARTSTWRPLVAAVFAFLLLMFVYELVRDIVAPSVTDPVPFDNAHDVIRLEESVGLFVEPDVQRLVHAIPGGRSATIWFYTLAYTVGYTLFLGWVFFFHRSRFLFAFTWYWMTNLLALVGYALYPLSPPRFMDGLGMEDTTKAALELGGALSWFQPFRNLFAAMPSMHVGQSVLYAVAVVALMKSRWRHLIWLWPACMLLTVMATANHWWLDGAVGAVVVGIAYLLTRLVLRDGLRGAEAG